MHKLSMINTSKVGIMSLDRFRKHDATSTDIRRHENNVYAPRVHLLSAHSCIVFNQLSRYVQEKAIYIILAKCSGHAHSMFIYW